MAVQRAQEGNSLQASCLDDLKENHGDQPLHVEASNSAEEKDVEGATPPTWTKEEEKKALRKLDWNLIPLLGSLYLVSYIDRGNIGNAYTAGMGHDWGITSEDYSWIVTVLYIGYILFHWLILVWTFVPLPLWTALMAIGWGSMSMLQAVTHNFAGIMALRFLIGAFEAGFVPAVALYMTFFYHRGEMGLRYGLFISFSPLASCFASALAYGLVTVKASIPNWKLLFLVEGAPTILLAVVAYFYLPPSPSQCRFLAARENEIISLRAFKGRGEKREGTLNLKQAFAAFYDYKNYLQAMIIFCLNTAFGSLPAYLPTILQSMGYTSLNAQGFSACPYLSAYVVCVTASFLSDRFRTRGIFVVLFCCVGAAGYVLLAIVHTTGVRYFATFLVCAGVFPAVALTFTWVTDNQGSASKRGAGLAIFGMVGQCGPILGARLFPKTEQPWYSKGMWICAGILFAAAILATILSLSLRYQNKKRDEKHGKSDLDYVPSEVSDEGDSHPMYRYVP
ncbi:major facilitator superfamily transporter [Colletotrichum truncatum]|uniref:Major facilitator superfamily transporter n=1 Tax=Colletotrichum truncatum TaxID=5467 RepID=A0ACC3YDY7_COLTU|nr:major facilitator superfamily transporter [Colletotrichum truncatum]KAF6790241.1 major facilitator superfamily transporter [Colletotrichum truncatum]